ncbi:MAG: trehalase [Leadbetterella sp.]|nr:trehalase [Leadbetterella sp.]
MATIVDQKKLFEAVQLSRLFEDSKSFPDMVATRNIEDISSDFEKKKTEPSFDLEKFISKNFRSVIPKNETFVTQHIGDPEQHIINLWDHLTKKTEPENLNSTYISLPNDFVVPGGRFQETYYWDSYFTMLGLIISKKNDLVLGMIKNFAFLIDQFGFIPNGNRTYFLSRSQPPFFSLMVDLLNDPEFSNKPIDFLSQLEKEYLFWMTKRSINMPDGEILNRYDDDSPTPRPESFIEDIELAEKSTRNSKEIYRNIRAACESGWDFSSRWFEKDGDLSTINTTNIVPVDLNCLLFFLEKQLASIHPTDGLRYSEKAHNRKIAIEKYFWNHDLGFFCDFDLAKKTVRSNLSLAGVFPLYFNIANKMQAESSAEILEQKFLKIGGLATTTIESGQQWDAPNGWAPLQWMAYVGLKNYGFRSLADKIKTNWIRLNETAFYKNGKFTEKYNVESTLAETGGGEYPNQDGFGWTNGVFLSLKKDH